MCFPPFRDVTREKAIAIIGKQRLCGCVIVEQNITTHIQLQECTHNSVHTKKVRTQQNILYIFLSIIEILCIHMCFVAFYCLSILVCGLSFRREKNSNLIEYTEEKKSLVLQH